HAQSHGGVGIQGHCRAGAWRSESIEQLTRFQKQRGAAMATSEYKPARVFTIEQANAMLPLVRAITTDLAKLAREVVERRHRLALLTSGRDLTPGDPYSDELAQMESHLERDAGRLQEYVEELRALGVEPKGAVE